ncbi:MAG: MFS transporter [Chloroflexi bacterium]|nr:MFS transporter [Chloroflexota bacterium]
MSRIHYGWIVVAAVFITMITSSGVRSSFSVFVKPWQAEFGWDRASVAGAAAIGLLLFGLLQPVIGRVCDRYGPRRVMGLALFLIGIGALASTQIQTKWQLYLVYGVLASLGFAGTAPTISSVVVGRWFVARRGLALGIITSGSSLGALALVPLTMAIVLAGGWRAGLAALGIFLAFVVAPTVFLLVRDDPSAKGAAAYGTRTPGTTIAAEREPSVDLRTALGSRPFWLLALPFLVCGYTTMGLTDTHLVPLAVEAGVPELSAATSIGVVGLFNAIGTVLAGVASDRWGRRYPLALIYLVRGLSLLILMIAHDALTLFVFAAIFGLAGFGTVPPLSALAIDFFGRRSLGSIFGSIVLMHQVGAATGAYVNGLIFDLTGSYLPALTLMIVLLIASAALTWLVDERSAHRVRARLGTLPAESRPLGRRPVNV